MSVQVPELSLGKERKDETRVLIVGLGVAGSYLACLLSLKGLQVDACDARSAPWHFIVCGEMVPDPDMLRGKIPSGLFRYLTMTHQEILRRTYILRTYDYLRIVVLDHEFYVPFKAHLIDKSRLIHELVAEAEQHVDVKFNTSVIKCQVRREYVEVTLLEDGRPREERYDIVIGADSFPSVCYTDEIWRWLSETNYLTVTCVAYRAAVYGIDTSCPTIIIDPRIAPGGYAWIFPRSGNEANVGLGFATEYCQDVKRYVDNFNRRYILRPLSKAASKTLPMDGLILRVGMEKMLLVGDAGGFVVPTNGAGINPAMISALLAYETDLDGNKYDTRAWKIFGRYSRKLAELRRCIDPLLRSADRLERAVRLVVSHRLSGQLLMSMLTSLLMGYFRIFDRIMYASLRIVSRALAL